MKKRTRNLIIGAACVLVVLALTFWLGDGASQPEGDSTDLSTNSVSPSPDPSDRAESPVASPSPSDSEGVEPSVSPDGEAASPTPTEEPSPETELTPDPTPSADPSPEASPEEIPEPDDGVLTCTLSVRCDTILNNMDQLRAEKWSVVPADGVLYATKEVVFYEGESVLNVLVREMKVAGIPMEYAMTPLYNSAYVEGIGNLYEFDCGELSGWMYRVNGWFPNYGCSRYTVSDGDRIEVVYTCDWGADVGGDYAAQRGE